tara:strand:+ start:791 stop:1060 length:270 start_codon:yes stop_codon:yes gene_type:complete
MIPIDECLINAINFRVNAHVPKQDTAIKNGDIVKCVDGPFFDLEAIFEERNAAKHCFILFNIMGPQKRNLVDETSIQKREARSKIDLCW